MPIKASCPHCDASFNFPDTAAGRKVRCKECEEPFLVRAPGRQNVIAKAPPPKPAAALVDPIDDEDEDDAPPTKNGKAKPAGEGEKKKKKLKKKQDSSAVKQYVLLGVLGVLLVGAGLYFFVFKGDAQEQVADGGDGDVTPEEPKDPVPPDGGDGKPPKKPLPPLDPDDPFAGYAADLQLDRVNKQTQILKAVDWFKTQKVDHPWREEIADRLELLLDHPNYETSDVCWETYAMWATPRNIDRMELHLGRAAKSAYRVWLMKALAAFGSVPAAEILATCLERPEKQLAHDLLAEMGKDIAREKVRPYVYAAEPSSRDLAYALLEAFEVDLDTVPRLPLPKTNPPLTLVTVIAELGDGPITVEGDGGEPGDGGNGENGGNEDNPGDVGEDNPEAAPVQNAVLLAKRARAIRHRKLAAMKWLMDQNLDREHWVPISKALNPFITMYDQFLRENALICLKRWATGQNVPAFQEAFKEPEFGGERSLMLTVLSEIPGPEAPNAMVEILAELEPDERLKLREVILSINNPEARKGMLRYFNDVDGSFRALAREAVVGYKLSRDSIAAQCIEDMGGEDAKKIAAMQWLTTAPPLNPMLRRKMREMAEGMVDDENGTIRGLARALVSGAAPPTPVPGPTPAPAPGGGADTPEAQLMLVQQPNFQDPATTPARHKAINALADAKNDEAVIPIAKLALRPEDQAVAVAALKRMGPIVDEKLIEALPAAATKAEKIEVAKMIEKVGTKACIDALKTEYDEAVQNPANATDLIPALNMAALAAAKR